MPIAATLETPKRIRPKRVPEAPELSQAPEPGRSWLRVQWAVLLLAIVLATAVANSGLSLYMGIKTGPDTLASYQAMRSMQRGSAFNTVVVPASEDIGTSVEHFLSWWTPGQYLLPWGVTSLTGLSLKSAEWLVTLGSFAAGMIGLYLLYRRLKFKGPALYFAVAVPGMLQFGVSFFDSYLGGVTLTFAVLPWLALSAIRARDMKGGSLFLMVVMAWLAFFMKSSALITFAAMLLFLLIDRARHHGALSKGLVKDLGKLAACGVLVVLPAEFLYLGNGETPASVRYDPLIIYVEHPPVIERVAYPFSAITEDFWHFPAYAVGKLAQVAGLGAAMNWLSVVGVVLLAILNLFLLWRLLLSESLSVEYKELLAAVVLTFCGAFLLMLLRTVISLESRHFREMLLIVIPGVVVLLLEGRRLKYLLVGVLVVGFAASEVQLLRRQYASSLVLDSTSELLHEDAKGKDVAIIQELDERLGGPGTLFYLTPWDRELDLVVRRSNVYPLGLAGTGIPSLRKTPFFAPEVSHPGRVDRLIVKTLRQATEAEVIAMFPSYDRFELIDESTEGRYWHGR